LLGRIGIVRCRIDEKILLTSLGDEVEHVRLNQIYLSDGGGDPPRRDDTPMKCFGLLRRHADSVVKSLSRWEWWSK
jgi:hypothetical protein